MGYRRATQAACALLFAFVGAAASCSGNGVEPGPDPLGPPPEALSLLFVGNSLTYFNDMPQMVDGLLREAGMESVFVASTSQPGYGLQDHWVDARTHAAIAAGGWDYVVLQQGPSATEGRPSLLDYTARFDDLAQAIQARTALYMVWPASSRDFDFDGVVDSYSTAASSVDGELFPAGEAWRAMWRRDPDAALYGSDGFHPSVLGSYLAALTIADRLVEGPLQPSGAIQTPSIRTTIPAELLSDLLASAEEANAAFP